MREGGEGAMAGQLCPSVDQLAASAILRRTQHASRTGWNEESRSGEGV